MAQLNLYKKDEIKKKLGLEKSKVSTREFIEEY